MSIQKEDGNWLNLNDGDTYRVSSDSIGSQATSWRRTETQSPYVEGKFLVHAVKDMTSVNLTVWVSGYPQNTHASGQNQLHANIEALIAPFEQMSYQIKYSMGDTQTTWECQTADYSVELSKEYVYAMYVPVKFTIPRFPTATRSAI
jgi:hypothetical protein